MDQLKRTPLYPAYAGQDGVKLTDFGGWELPVQFAAGIMAEHRCVRANAGIFDVSHMGEIIIKGTGAADYLDLLISGNAGKMRPGSCLYTILPLPEGGAVDDLVIYRLAENEFMLVVNAANIEKDFAWITSTNPEAASSGNLTIENHSDQWTQIAVQGPKAEKFLQELSNVNLADIPFYNFLTGVLICGVKTIVSRTGYTGEDGFEIYAPSSEGAALWTTLVNHGSDRGILPCGLGARDTLRLEARLPLYGHELTADAGPLEGGVKSFVDFSKPAFIGREALVRMDNSGSYRILRGARMIDKGVPRQGYPVFLEGNKIGTVTSGGKSPSLDQFIAIIRVPKGLVKTGSVIEIEINGRRRRAEIVPTPFYKKNYGGEK